jgi:hypothetical protein
LIEKIIIQSENQKEDTVQKVISISGNGDPISETQKEGPFHKVISISGNGDPISITQKKTQKSNNEITPRSRKQTHAKNKTQKTTTRMIK